MNGAAADRPSLGEAPTPLAGSGGPLLEQRLVTCPGCGRPSALHVDEQAWLVVRFVCPTSCRLDQAVIDALIGPDTAAMIA